MFHFSNNLLVFDGGPFPGEGAFTRPCGRGRLELSDGWCNAPPILSFAKRENAPCTVEERKRGRAGACLRFLRMSPARGVVRAGGLAVDVRPVLPSSLPLTWRLLQNCGYRLLFRCVPWRRRFASRHFSVPTSARVAAAEREVSPFDEIPTPAKTTPRAKDIRKTGSIACALGEWPGRGTGPHKVVYRQKVPITSFSLLDRARPVFSFPSGRKNGAPAGAQRSGSGGERRKERSRAETSPSGGGGAGGVSSDDMGGAMNQLAS